MMTLPDLTVLRPGSVAEAVEALRANPGARVLAGGTDIVPNLKYGMYDTRHLAALRGLSSDLRCVAAASNDTAPVLLALDASVKTISPRGERTIALHEFYVADGLHNTVLAPDELLTEVRIPAAAARRRQAFAKLRMRAAIDFPALNLAVALELDGHSVKSVSLAVSALAARPALIKGLQDLHGHTADAIFAEELGRRAHKQCKPLTNIGVDPEWRHDVLPVLVRRTVLRAIG